VKLGSLLKVVALLSILQVADLEATVMWNDIDLYHAFRDFTSDPVSFPGEEMRAFIRELVRPTAAFTDSISYECPAGRK